MTFVRKADEVQAEQWLNTPESTARVLKLVGDRLKSIQINPKEGNHLVLETGGSDKTVSINDWVAIDDYDNIFVYSDKVFLRAFKSI